MEQKSDLEKDVDCFLSLITPEKVKKMECKHISDDDWCYCTFLNDICEFEILEECLYFEEKEDQPIDLRGER